MRRASVATSEVHNDRAHGVVVSHPLSMREALGSIPSVSSCAARSRFADACGCSLRLANVPIIPQKKTSLHLLFGVAMLMSE